MAAVVSNKFLRVESYWRLSSIGAMVLVLIKRFTLLAGIAVTLISVLPPVAAIDADYFEEGYVVETVLDGNKLALAVHSIYADMDGGASVVALDSAKSSLLKLGLPLSRGSEIERIAGSPGGKAGYRDGRADEALFDHPKKLAFDDDGNIYIADTKNLAIRKLSKAGFVTTIVGGSNRTGHTDGQGREASFSNDFDVAYVPSCCCLLVSDRGNRMIRQIQLPQVNGRCPGLRPRAPASNLTNVTLYLAFFGAGVVVTILAFKCWSMRLRSSLCWATTGSPMSPPQETGQLSFSIPQQMKEQTKTIFSAMRNAAAEFFIWGPFLAMEFASAFFEMFAYLVLYSMSLPLGLLCSQPVHTSVTNQPRPLEGETDLLGFTEILYPQQTCNLDSRRSLSAKPGTLARIAGLGRVFFDTSPSSQVKNSKQDASELANSLIVNDLIDFSEPAESKANQSTSRIDSKTIGFSPPHGIDKLPMPLVADSESKMDDLVQKCLSGLAPQSTVARPSELNRFLGYLC